MLHKLLAGHRSHIRSILSIMLCLALICGTVASMSVFAAEPETAAETAVEETSTENTAGETTVAMETSTEADSIVSSESTEEMSSEEVTETPTEKVTETSTESVTEGVTESISEATTETESASEAETSDGAESSTLSLGSSVSATADDGISLTAISGDTTVAVGSSITLTGSTGNGHSWTYASDNGGAISFGNTNSSSVTVTGVTEGTVTITHSYRSGWNTYTETYEVTVTAASTIVTVYVFVSGFVQGSNPKEYFSGDMLNLLNVNTLDSYGYFAAGVIYLDMSKFSSSSTTSRITTEEEWDYVISVIKDYLYTNYSETCPDNLIAQYAEQIIKDIGYTQGNGYSGLWLAGGHSNISDAGGEVSGQYWHLDIRFQTVSITYIYGENGITTSDSDVAYDGNTAGSKVFIQGATMDYTPTIEAPDGWKIVGYYTTPDFQEGTEWDAVGQPINEDTTVYIKIVPKEDVVINYVVAEGVGTVTNPSNNDAAAQNGYENFNPTTGSPVGSTAEAGNGYEFEGWYSDVELTDKVSSNTKYVPSTQTGDWPEGAEYTYYAKFVPVKTTVTVNKVWDDDENDSLRPNSVTVKLYADNEATGASAEITSNDSWTYTFTDLNKYSYNDDGTVNAEIKYTVKEDEVEGYTSKVTVGENGTIIVTNTLSTATVTLTKVVAGNMGVQSKEFTFSVSYTDASGAARNVTYKLTGEEGNNTESFEVKLGTNVAITETQEGLYVMSATVNGATETVSNNTVTVTVNENSDIVVTNTYNATPDTGVNLDSAPYIAILFGVVLLGAVALIHRRKRLL